MSARRRRQKQPTGSPSPSTAAGKIAVANVPRPPLSRRRTWLFRLVVLIVAPLLFFSLLEAGLRLGGYGYATAFFFGPDAGGAYASNPRFGWRFFPRSLARRPAPCVLSAKPADTVRIFVLGSSAAQGIPDPSFGVARILEVLLRERYPDVKFEVVNAAMTAINSHVAVEIARDCIAHQPDLFVVYMGNNEVVGPYGPGTVFEQWSPSLRFIRANIWLKSTRTGQLLADTTAWLHSREGSPTAWQGMEMFTGNEVTADDPRLRAVYGNFRQNLMDICGVARRGSAGVILSTVAVNLKDCPPFASQHRSGLSAKELRQWKSLYEAGVARESKEKWREAVAQYEAAAKIDDRFADLAFRRGRCLAALGQSTEARDQFVLARDLDGLRFRADSKLNAIIRAVAAEQEAAGVRLADAEQSLAKSGLAVGGISGEALFYEHVHFTFDGNYLLARTLLEEVEAAVPRLAASRKQEPILSRDQCAESLALSPCDECQMADSMTQMTSRPPFTAQLDHAVRQASALERMEELRRRSSTKIAVQAACALDKAALEKTPDDCYLHYRLGKLLLANGQPEAAIEHLRIVRKKWPWEAIVCDDLANAARACGRIDEAMTEYHKALEIDANCAMAHYDLANALNEQRKLDEAIAEFQKAVAVNPQFIEARNNLGNTLRKRGRIDEAIAELRKALEVDPKSVMVHNSLGNALRSCGQLDPAIAEFRAAVETDPACMAAHYGLANALGSKGKADEAIAEYQAALKIEPKVLVVLNNLGNALLSRGRLDEAIAQFRTALEVDANSALGHHNLGLALIRARRLDEAIAHFQRALELKPDDEEARANLAKALKMRDEGSAG
jgi:tetratricopeptide (TPR) repeat protein